MTNPDSSNYTKEIKQEFTDLKKYWRRAHRHKEKSNFYFTHCKVIIYTLIRKHKFDPSFVSLYLKISRQQISNIVRNFKEKGGEES